MSAFSKWKIEKIKRKSSHTHTHTHISKTIFSENCIITRTEIIMDMFNDNLAQTHTHAQNKE
jgi:hypothetical protein